MSISELYKHFRTCPEICIDSRKVIPNAIFFALKGPHYDGHAFADDALQKGCSIAVVEDVSRKNDGRFIVVPDVLNTLQNLASFHRTQLDLPILAITGSNGKTTTKELIHVMLARSKKVVSTQGNLNNHIGLPLTLLRITDETEIGVVEMGANHLHEIRQLCTIAQPTHGLITNIGKAHIEGFGSFENVIRAKSELYEWLAIHGGTIFRNSDNQVLVNITTSGARIVDYSVTSNMFSDIRSNPYFEAVWNRPGQTCHLESQLFGSYNSENVAAAITVTQFFGVSAADIQTALAGYVPMNHRSQIIQTPHNMVFMDAYNANPSSMIPAISDFVDTRGEKKMVILGDMFELGVESANAHDQVVQFISGVTGLEAIFIGKEFLKAAKETGYLHFIGVEEALEYLKTHPVRDAQVLLKGSRAMSLEKLLPCL